MAGLGTYTYNYPRPAVTVDIALVTREERPRILLIRRGQHPFAGFWALPGGFVEQDESLEKAARRELIEETGVVIGELEQIQTFGNPGRDPRGWTISVVYLARVDADKTPAKAGDDASETAWHHLDAELPMAFDHADILATIRARVGVV